MSATELEKEIAGGVVFWVAEQEERLSGVIGIQDKGDVALVRHAYVAPTAQRSGVGTRLLRRVEGLVDKPVLIGTWAAASWAIEFYRRNGFTLIGRGDKDRLLRTYWSIPARQIETSVVLANGRWIDAQQRGCTRQLIGGVTRVSFPLSSTTVHSSHMNLAVNPPVLPMLAKRVGELPPGEGWIFEPKWDGFRTLIFRDGEEVFIQSRDEKPLNRYFPELIDPLKAQLPERCALDGEIVIAHNDGLNFDLLQMRLHPAASRVNKLAVETPASVVFFDLLCEGNKSLCDKPFGERRAKLEALLSSAEPPLHLTPATRDRDTAADWFRRFEGAGLDGVVAKAEAGIYEPNKRTMLKVKHERDCDCVVAGFRWHKKGDKTALGSLLLGLYDDSENLEHVGVCASFTNAKRLELVEFLAPYRKNALDGHPWREWAEGQPKDDDGDHRRPGAQSRWSAGKDLSWEPLRPELVVQVAYDHMQGDRFRHTAQFRRWRNDKRPRDCTFDQLEVVPPQELAEIFVTGR